PRPETMDRLPRKADDRSVDGANWERRREGGDGSDPRVLRALKLRARSRQFDGQALAALQARNHSLRDDSLEGGLLRVNRGRQDALLQAEDRDIPGRRRARRRRGKGDR